MTAWDAVIGAGVALVGLVLLDCSRRLKSGRGTRGSGPLVVAAAEVEPDSPPVPSAAPEWPSDELAPSWFPDGDQLFDHRPAFERLIEGRYR